MCSVERLWRTVKYEEVYLKEYENAWQAETSLREYFEFYRYDRRHQGLITARRRSVRIKSDRRGRGREVTKPRWNVGVRDGDRGDDARAASPQFKISGRPCGGGGEGNESTTKQPL